MNLGAITAAQKEATLATFAHGEQVHNPLDYQTYIWQNQVQMAATFKAYMAANFSATILLLDWPNTATANSKAWDTALLALADAAQTGPHKAIVLASMAERRPAHAIKACLAHGMVPMIGIQQCLTALNHAYIIGQAFAAPVPKALSIRHIDASFDAQTPRLCEAQSKRQLKQYDVPIPLGKTVSNLEQLLKVVSHLGYPVTLKAVAANLAHKSELGAIKLNLNNQAQVSQAAKALFALSDTLLVEQIILDSLAELIIGINTDPLFGQYLVLGACGILVEILQDANSLLLPTNKKEIMHSLCKLKCAPLLRGYRGSAPADMEAIVEAVMAVLDYSQQHPVYELDINPLLALQQGAVAVDALIHLGHTKL